MKLSTPFAKLPIVFDADQLVREMQAIPDTGWVAHPDGLKGNDAALLVTPGGRLEQGLMGSMAATPFLQQSSYIRQVMSELGCVWGRSRLMGLAPGATIDPHVDAHYHWQTHWRLHIPVVTNPGVQFTCGDETVHMREGECWTFDSFRMHSVRNEGSEKRVHLVLDTVGGGRLHELLTRAQSGSAAGEQDETILPDGRGDHEPLFEHTNVPSVMTPWEMRSHIAFLLDRCEPSGALQPIRYELERLIDRWTAAWARWGDAPARYPDYLQIVLESRDNLRALGADQIQLSNKMPLLHCLRQIVFLMAVERPERASSWGEARPAQPVPQAMG